MKKFAKAIAAFTVFIAGIPALAAWGISWLWNAVLTGVCGFAAIGFWQGLGLFLLGQLLTGGFVIAVFLFMGCMHKIFSHDGDWHSHWHGMSSEEKRAFIQRRRREHAGYRHNDKTPGADAAAE